MYTLSVSIVIYNIFSHGAASYALNGKNNCIMLDYRYCHKNGKLVLLRYCAVVEWLEQLGREANSRRKVVNSNLGFPSDDWKTFSPAINWCQFRIRER